ncbi:hypothetical protein DNTS_026170 [Danionella cerebrum]|uniref:Uncharacterized protein n=1 Tax=Danionella cerebrum TaxID=2873325 RepID=A0A553RI12_9TELE|nr:hypothetical protein DNTS_026170 [Danionella translucida]
MVMDSLRAKMRHHRTPLHFDPTDSCRKNSQRLLCNCLNILGLFLHREEERDFSRADVLAAEGSRKQLLTRGWRFQTNERPRGYGGNGMMADWEKESQREHVIKAELRPFAGQADARDGREDEKKSRLVSHKALMDWGREATMLFRKPRP